MQYLPSEQSRLADDEEMMELVTEIVCVQQCFCRVIREMKASVACKISGDTA